MNKVKVILCSILIILIIFGNGLGEGESIKGYFITKNDMTQIVEEFISLKKYGEYECEYKGLIQKIPYTDIKSLTYLGNYFVLVTMRNGKQFKVNGNNAGIRSAGIRVDEFAYYDPINEKYLKNKIKHVKKVVFDEDFGSLKECPQCGKTFISDYLFCPYDKAKMKLIQIKIKD